MTPQESQARLKARIWKSLAQSTVDTSKLSDAELETLVDVTTAAALLELDDQLGQTAREAESEMAPTQGSDPDSSDDQLFLDGKEDTLWEGRPFLSMTTHYLITDERIRITHGLLGKSSENVELVRVQDMDYSQSVFERSIRIGDVTVRSHDSHKPIIKLNNVVDPQGVYEILRKAVLNARKRHGFTYREEM